MRSAGFVGLAGYTLTEGFVVSNDSDQSFIAEALPAFISEAQEQIQSLEQLLLELEDNPGDRELLNALFRCAHTVKGSAGIFGLDRVVAFTHHVETLLDRLREGQLDLTPTISTLLLKCNDQILNLVEQARQADAEEPDGQAAIRDNLVEQLQAAAGVSSEGKPASIPQGANAAVVDGSISKRWHISVGFGTEVFRNGMDPLAIINYLRKIGELPNIACDIDAIPLIDQIDPESCHLAFEMALLSDASRNDIEGAFSFVRDDCRLTVLKPTRSAEEFAELIASMPDNPRLGDILVSVGAITRVQLKNGLKIQAESAAKGEALPLGVVLQKEANVSAKVVDAALIKQARQREGTAAAPAPHSDEQRFIRVQADRLDEVINLLGELVTASAGASLLAQQSRQASLVEANEQIGQLVEEIRNGTLQLRMVPIGETFSRFRRVVRDTAAELGKEVQLEIVGGETELDKSMVERIADPLMHLVRNALDHGLESPQERTSNGKAEQGKLVLSACHESGSVMIRIDDDGRGIQREKVLARAWDRGLVERGVTPPDAEIDRLIFEPGFSTAEKITNLSGRGVGMDVVRRNIEALRGTVSLSSDTGKGSRIEIRLPLTLAIIDGFLVGVGGSQFIFPLDAVVEVIENSGEEGGVDDRGRHLVELRGNMLPVVCLRTLYQIEGDKSERNSVVVIRANGQRFGVLVDQILGQHQTVIKPLGQLLRSLRGISGSSILANGEVALIFDVNSLCDLASVQRIQPARV